MPIQLGVQGYVWHQIYTDQRGLAVNSHLDEILPQVAAAGVSCWEQSIDSPEHASILADLLPRHGLTMSSMYVGPSLHDPAISTSEIERILAKCRLGRCLGVSVVVCNPAPLSWSQPMDKSDQQLRHQAAALGKLGRALRIEGMALAYHTHATEMRCSAREFHHMLLNTDPQDVGLCLDTHWVYRGAGNSQAALYDILKLYGDRLKSLHLRQSTNHIWSETFSQGDIDYLPLASHLKSMNFSGPLTLEQCSEPGTPQNLSPEERLRQSATYARSLFA